MMDIVSRNEMDIDHVCVCGPLALFYFRHYLVHKLGSYDLLLMQS